MNTNLMFAITCNSNRINSTDTYSHAI